MTLPRPLAAFVLACLTAAARAEEPRIFEWWLETGPEVVEAPPQLRVRAYDYGGGFDTTWAVSNEHVYCLPADSAGFLALYEFRIASYPFWKEPYYGPGVPYHLPPLRTATMVGGEAVFDSLSPGVYYVMACLIRSMPVVWQKMSPGEVPHSVFRNHYVPVWAYAEVFGPVTRVTMRWQNWSGGADPARPVACFRLKPCSTQDARCAAFGLCDSLSTDQ
jgi:hypothetical protein